MLDREGIKKELDELQSVVEIFRQYNDCNHIVKESTDGNILIIHRGDRIEGEFDPEEPEYEDVVLVSPTGMTRRVKRKEIYERFNTGREMIY